MSVLTDDQFLAEQSRFCEGRQIPSLLTYANTNVGLALTTKGLIPVNGLRHPPRDYSNGWFVWAGEQFDTSTDFFSPVHAIHVADIFPEAVRFLGLPPGYRFLAQGDYIDIWFDSSLLEDEYRTQRSQS